MPYACPTAGSTRGWGLCATPDRAVSSTNHSFCCFSRPPVLPVVSFQLSRAAATAPSFPLLNKHKQSHGGQWAKHRRKNRRAVSRPPSLNLLIPTRLRPRPNSASTTTRRRNRKKFTADEKMYSVSFFQSLKLSPKSYGQLEESLEQKKVRNYKDGGWTSQSKSLG